MKTPQNENQQQTHRLVLHDLHADYYFPYHDIIGIEATNTQVLIHTLPGSGHEAKIVISKTLLQIEKILDRGHFIRAHKSWIVHLKHVCKHKKHNGHSLLLCNGQSIPVSRDKIKFVTEALLNYNPTVY